MKYLIVFIFPLKCIRTNNSFCKMADHMDHSSWPRDQSAASSLARGLPHCRNMAGAAGPTLIRKYIFFVKTSKAGREMMTDTSGLSVFSKYTGILNYIWYFSLFLEIFWEIFVTKTVLVVRRWSRHFTSSTFLGGKESSSSKFWIRIRFQSWIKSFNSRGCSASVGLIEKYPNSNDHWSS